MKHTLFIFSFLAAVVACKSPGENPHVALPSGRYLNTTVLQGCPQKMPSDIPHYSLQMEFNGKDSVTMDNGFETFALAVSPADKDGEYSVVKASLYGDMKLIVSADSTVILWDTAWTKVASPSVFTHYAAGVMAGYTFTQALQDCAVAGEYTLFKRGDIVGIVTLTPEGKITGVDNYVSYELCYAGDCLEESDPPSRIILLTDKEGNSEMFALKPVEGKMALEFYQLGDPLPDEKGGRAIGEMIYELRTE